MSGYFNANSNPASCAPYTTCSAASYVEEDTAPSSSNDRTCKCMSGYFNANSNPASCAPYTTCSAAGNVEEDTAPSSSNDRTCQCMSGYFNANLNPASCTAHTPFTDASLDCHANGKPTFDGDSWNDNWCGTECGTDMMIDTNSASSDFNTCVAHTTFTTLGCHDRGEPNVPGSRGRDDLFQFGSRYHLLRPPSAANTVSFLIPPT